ncbi:putative cell-wall-anchored protein SasA (LPXTG motif) [Lactococcus lactis]|nr:putative cell-wall-anchored protein SasA (LPXTG motif) [Lactococcus lactis]
MPNNFLTPDGLHWSANTEVIPITGQVTGQISTENFGQTDGPDHTCDHLYYECRRFWTNY